jgi:rhodanese-related sulfurtransferase
MDGGKFETWLGSIVAPNEPFYLIAENESALESIIRKTAKIGYESFIKGALTTPENLQLTAKSTDYQDFRDNPGNYTIVDIRNVGEINTRRIFPNALEIPLPELRERLNEIPAGKPIMVHCAGGYRSAAGASIIQPFTSELVFDLSDEISKY